MHTVPRPTPRILAALLLCPVAGCATPRPSSLLGGELELLTPYAGQLSQSCTHGRFTLTLADRSPVEIATNPGIKESSWQLDTCGYHFDLTLDCSWGKKGVWCGSHEWPHPLAPDRDLALEIESAVALAPKCDRERSCHRGRWCAGDGFRVTRLHGFKQYSSEGWESTYEVERCGQTVQLEVRCTRTPPHACHAQRSGP